MVTIKSIHIKNFRSIVDEKIELSNFNCFVGKNDSGKSNVLKALNLFFNNKTDFDTEFDFESDYSRFAKRGQKQAREIAITVEVVIPETYSESGAKEWTKIWRAEGLHDDNLQKLFKPGSKGVTLLNRTQYLYIPAVKSNEYFQDLLSDVYTSMTEAANSELRVLNEEYSERLQQLTSELTYQIRDVLGLRSAIQMPSNLSTLFRDLSFSTSDNYVKNIDLRQRGDGIKARHIPSILQYLQKNTERGRRKWSIGGSYIWGFEEPENGVEYAACFEMADEIYKYRENTQILVTTHSPAFYMKNGNDDVTCYHVYKNSNGASAYTSNIIIEDLNENLGFLPIIAPYIKQAHDKFVQEKANIESELERVKQDLINVSNKIVIITEGKTDIKHIRTAFSQLGIEQEMLDRIKYFDFTTQKTLGSDIDNLLKYLSSMPNVNIIVAIVDRDTGIVRGPNGECYEKRPNKVYKFNIPALENEERNKDSKICIEHYYSNSEIHTETGFGHLYMGMDFNEFGCSNDGKWIFKDRARNKGLTDIAIIDGGNNHLQRIAVDAHAATKDQFAEYVCAHPTEFNFENFRKIYDVICDIYQSTQITEPTKV